MTTPATLPEPKRKRGNPNWGSGIIKERPSAPTEFEHLVRELRLSKEMYTSSHELYVWCRANRNRVYVPEWLLKEWNLTVEISFGTAA